MTQGWTAFDVLRTQTVLEGGSPTLDTRFDWQATLRGPTELGTYTGGRSYDSAQRLKGISFSGQGGALVQGEALQRDARGLLTHRVRQDLNNFGWDATYDGAERLRSAAWTAFDDEGNPISGEQHLTSLASSFGYTLDEADNLTRIDETLSCGAERATELPLDGSGRNRPGQVGNETTDWDANGNLKAKGDLRFTYDYLNRLVKVERQVDENTRVTVAKYTYDPLNRRVLRQVGAEVYRTVWDGWRPIEEYLDSDGGALVSRRVYGPELDEMVRFEARVNATDTTLSNFTPVTTRLATSS